MFDAPRFHYSVQVNIVAVENYYYVFIYLLYVRRHCMQRNDYSQCGVLALLIKPFHIFLACFFCIEKMNGFAYKVLVRDKNYTLTINERNHLKTVRNWYLQHTHTHTLFPSRIYTLLHVDWSNAQCAHTEDKIEISVKCWPINLVPPLGCPGHTRYHLIRVA